METKINIASVDGNEITIREGDALPLKEPVKINLTGDICSISNFLGKRTAGEKTQAVNPATAVVVADKNAMVIELFLDPENIYGLCIKAKLEDSEEVKNFSINKPKTFKREELVKLLRFSKLHFDDAEKHDAITKAYTAFNAKAYVDMAQDSDTRGNKTNNFTKKVETNLPTEFVLNVPIFKGQQKERFRVEICLDVTDGGASFWFESVELHELTQTRIDEIFAKELESCKDFPIIYK